jgi:ubiquinone/menaquinone biosynthesis C-methylase UbiE
MSELQFSYGIPTKKEYDQLLSTSFFSGLEAFSNNFLKVCDHELSYYKKKWVLDPLHQWSRQYEYPFVFSEIQRDVPSTQFSVLDAGSGLTFFPFLLKSSFPNAVIHCCDYDENLAELYTAISRKTNSEVHFISSDIRNLPYDGNQFDVLYCISVLEHTNNFEKVLDEFKRVLKPAGKLILTFDIALDNFSDIPAPVAEQLLSSIADRFHVTIEPINLSSSDIVTTEDFKNSSLLPWKYGIRQVAKNLLRGKVAQLKHHLTFYCISGKK